MPKIITCLSLSCFITFSLLAQTKEPCATTAVHEHLLKTDPDYKKRLEQQEAFIQQYAQSSASKQAGTIYIIPLVVHIMHRGEAISTTAAPTPNISDAQVQSAIVALNEDYRRKSGTNGFGNGVDTEIQFCLASKDPNGNPSTGINRVNASSVTNYSTGGINYAGGNELQLKALSRWDNTRYYNIWLVTEIENNDGGAGIQGYAYYPGAPSDRDGAVMLYNAFGTTGNLKSYTNLNRVAAHEIGHGLNIYHTFEGDQSGCPTNGNCATDGDKVCDIPPHTKTSSTCPADNTANPCQAGSTAADYIHNYMDYSTDACKNMFTAGQTTRMRASLASGGLRANLATPSNVTACGCGIVPIPDFSVSKSNPCEGEPVQFTDLSTESPTAWAWTFQNGTPATSTVKNPVVSFSGTGPYNVSLKATNAYGASSDLVKTAYVNPKMIQTLPAATQSFESATFPPEDWEITGTLQADDAAWARTTAAFSGTGNASIILANKEKAALVGTNSITTPPYDLTDANEPKLFFNVAYERFYDDYTDSLVITYSTDCGQTFIPTGYKKGYADLFTVTGNGADYTCLPPKCTGVVFNPFVPVASEWRKDSVQLNGLVGQAKVLFRFERRKGSAGTSNNLYLDNIVVSEKLVAPLADFTADKTSICAGQSVHFTDLSTKKPSGWSWTFPGGNPSVSSDRNPDVTYTTPGTYTVTLTANNTAGSDVESRTDYITVNPVPSVPVVTGNTSLCSGEDLVLTAASDVAGAQFNWFDAAQNGNLLYTGSVYTIPAATNAVTVYTEASANGCTSTARAMTVVQIKARPLAPVVKDRLVCSGQSVNLTAESPAGVSFKWFDEPTGGASFYEGNTYTTPALTATDTFYVSSYSVDGCYSLIRSKVIAAVVTSTPKAAGINDTVCTGDPATLTALEPSGATFRWYTAALGGTPVFTGTSLILPALPSDTSFWLEAQLTGCDSSAERSEVTAKVTDLAADFNATPLSGPAPLTVNFLNSGNPAYSYSWKFGDSFTSAAFAPSHTYTNQGTYTVELSYTDGTCMEKITKNAFITVTPVGLASSMQAIARIYPNPASEILFIEGFSAGTIRSVKLVDVLGRISAIPFSEDPATTVIQVKTNEIPEGMYLLVLDTAHEQLRRWICINRP